MFGISFGEFLVIFVIALIVIGPEKLPETIRAVSSVVRKVKNFSDQVRGEVEKEFKVDELKRSFTEVTNDIKGDLLGSHKELNSLKEELQKTKGEAESTLKALEQSFKENIITDEPHSYFDDEYHGDVMDHEHHEMVVPPKTFHTKIETKYAINDDIKNLKMRCATRQFELVREVLPSAEYKVYELKYHQVRKQNDLTQIMFDYYGRLETLNHDAMENKG